jgi:hypothetical protein
MIKIYSKPISKCHNEFPEQLVCANRYIKKLNYKISK